LIEEEEEEEEEDEEEEEGARILLQQWTVTLILKNMCKKLNFFNTLPETGCSFFR
jgi:hypothetical protein